MTIVAPAVLPVPTFPVTDRTPVLNTSTEAIQADDEFRQASSPFIDGDETMRDNITLDIATPNGVFTGTFDKTTKVEDVIVAVVAAQHLAEGDAFDLVHNGEVLQPKQRPIVSFGLSGTVKLELVATGSGV